MLSQGCAGGDCGRSEHGQASPTDTPSICVREAGQIDARPSISTDQSMGRGTIGTDEASVEGWESR